MAFKMRSGNKTVFKKMGSSPVKQEKPKKLQLDDLTYKGKTYPEVKISGEKSILLPEVKIVEKKKVKKVKEKPIYKDPIVPSEIKKPTETKKKDWALSKAIKGIKEEKERKKRKTARRKLEDKRKKYIKKTKAIIGVLDKPGL